MWYLWNSGSRLLWETGHLKEWATDNIIYICSSCCASVFPYISWQLTISVSILSAHQREDKLPRLPILSREYLFAMCCLFIWAYRTYEYITDFFDHSFLLLWDLWKGTTIVGVFSQFEATVMTWDHLLLSFEPVVWDPCLLYLGCRELNFPTYQR